MRGRLSDADLPALRTLTARRLDEAIDPAMALLDGWSCLGHILGFYNERLVNEHYLRTCTERRSALEIARLVGYAPRPGVAADAFLAFTVDDADKEESLKVPAGTRAYSQPGPGETMQPFETTEDLWGRPRWNEMRPRLTEPQRIFKASKFIYLKGITTGLRKGDTLLVEGVEDGDDEKPFRTVVAAVEALPAQNQATQDQTRIELDRETAPVGAPGPAAISAKLLERLIREPAAYLGARERLALNPEEIFTGRSYAAYGLLQAAYPGLREHLAAAVGGTAPGGAKGTITVYAMRIKAALHGHNASLIPDFDTETGKVTRYRKWNVEGTDKRPEGTEGEGGEGAGPLLGAEEAVKLGPKEIALDAVYDGIIPGSRVMIVRPDAEGKAVTGVFGVNEVRTVTRSNFNLPARVTVLTLNEAWPTGKEKVDTGRTVVYAQSERLELADMPIKGPVAGKSLELDGYYPGLHPGRRIVVTGERADLGGTGGGPDPEVRGVRTAELLMIAAVEHKVREDETGQVSNDTIHTVITFERPGLNLQYRLDTVRILGNVAQATHGESRAEVLGGGDATRPIQQFALKQGPLTYVSAPTPEGVASTLESIVNDIRWKEAPSPAAVTEGERRYVLRTDDGGITAVVFGFGARLPAGQDNVRVRYRSGLGSPGNVRAGQISVLATRPNGVTGVSNPIAASGGADRDGVDSIKRRASVGLSALDRLVSAADVEDFARAFAGIGKASIRKEADGTSTPLPYFLTLAGENDAPLSKDSAVIVNLRAALKRFGNFKSGPDGLLETLGTPAVTVDLRIRRALLLGIRAEVRVHPEHVWEEVLPRITRALSDTFGFDARQIGQVPRPGEALAVMQAVRGVVRVDLQAFGTIDTSRADSINLPRTPEEVAGDALALLTGTAVSVPTVGADQIAYLSPAAPGTLLISPTSEEPAS